MTARASLALACAAVLASACAELAPDYRALPVVEERYVTARRPGDNVGSMSVWTNPQRGALFASYADAAVSAFDWRDVTQAAGIPANCP